jgi:hypothetical protein
VARQTQPMAEQVVDGAEIADGWLLIERLPVTLEADGADCFIVSDDLFGVYGDGKTPGEAWDDYWTSLIDYYQILAAEPASDRPTRALFNKLRRYLRAR